MATETDATLFRTISDDGELIDGTASITGNTLTDFTDYTATQDVPRSTAQWVTEDGEVLAEASEASGLIAYPAASLFAY